MTMLLNNAAFALIVFNLQLQLQSHQAHDTVHTS